MFTFTVVLWVIFFVTVVSNLGSYPDGDLGLYLASLTSQGDAFGFHAPMNQQRRPRQFRSSYDPSVRMLAGPGYTGPVCPSGHRLKTRLYKRSGWHCDKCEKDFQAGSSGHRCKVK
jgi:hypothetical protein